MQGGRRKTAFLFAGGGSALNDNELRVRTKLLQLAESAQVRITIADNSRQRHLDARHLLSGDNLILLRANHRGEREPILGLVAVLLK